MTQKRCFDNDKYDIYEISLYGRFHALYVITYQFTSRSNSSGNYTCKQTELFLTLISMSCNCDCCQEIVTVGLAHREKNW